MELTDGGGGEDDFSDLQAFVSSQLPMGKRLKQTQIRTGQYYLKSPTKLLLLYLLRERCQGYGKKRKLKVTN